MAGLALFTSGQWNALQIAGAQAASMTPLDFSIGSDTLALVEAATASLLYLQADAVVLLSLTRAATSNDTDLDSWMADFAFPRLAATKATGAVTLHRDQATTQIFIPANGTAYLILSDGSQSYQIVADGAQPTYDVVNNRYTLSVGVNNIAVTCVAVNAGPTANVPVGSTLLLGSNTVGIDTASVTAGFANGQPAETDAALRARFVLYINSLSRAVPAAIAYSVTSTQQGLTYTIGNNQAPDGSFEPGNFVVTVDDGSGSPPDSLIAAVDANIIAYQGNTISHNTRKPTIISVTISMTITLTSGSTLAAVQALAVAAVTSYINTLPLGTLLSITRLSAVAFNASPSIYNVSAVMINGGASDVIVLPSQVVKLAAGGLTITPVIGN